MKASDVMVSNVITVGPAARVQDVVDVLLKNRISAVPVVDANGKLLGIVSEGDLIRRPEGGTEYRRAAWLEMLTSKEVLAAEFVKSHSQNITDIMTRNVVTAEPDTPVGTIAAMLEKHRIKRVPIVRDGQVIGIVSRANLLQALASLGRQQMAKTTTANSKIRAQVIAQLNSTPWARSALVNVIIRDGTVDLFGVVDTQAERKAVRVLVEVTPGVRAVNDNLSIWPKLSNT